MTKIYSYGCVGEHFSSQRGTFESFWTENSAFKLDLIWVSSKDFSWVSEWNIFHWLLVYNIYLVGNRDSQDLQQLGRLGGAMWTSHCLSFSSAKGSPGCLTSGFCTEIEMIYFSTIHQNEFHSFQAHISPLQTLHCYRCLKDPM